MLMLLVWELHVENLNKVLDLQTRLAHTKCLKDVVL